MIPVSNPFAPQTAADTVCNIGERIVLAQRKVGAIKAGSIVLARLSTRPADGLASLVMTSLANGAISAIGGT
jgi:hypothetical protein